MRDIDPYSNRADVTLYVTPLNPSAAIKKRQKKGV
jgi:hypothetical protein